MPLRVLTELSSRKWISRITGKFAKSKLSRGMIPRFAKLYKINVEEAEKGLAEYQTLNEFFTRRLKEHARTVDEQAHTIVSPVDAVITGIGKINQGAPFTVKGQQYTLAELLDCEDKAKEYANGHFVVLYLSPTDYHRIHVPLAGQIIDHKHCPGKVYPVNDFGLKNMKRVLSRNERMISYIKQDETEVAVIKVGAMNVASIQMSDRLDTHAGLINTKVKKGDELAYFEFGSTVVLLVNQQEFKFRADLTEGSKIRMGEVLGEL